MPQFYVYVYRDPSRRNEPIYVGKGLGNRAYEHLNDAQNNHFKNRLAKMKREGVDPIINVVGMPSEALALLCEVDTIARFGRKDLGLGPLLNLTDGGEGASGRITRDDTKQKLSKIAKGKTRSEETKQKMSEAKKGKPFSLKHRQSLSVSKKGENNPNYKKPRSLGTRQKMSITQKGVRTGVPQQVLVCPHCGKEGGNAMKMWHFDKCKYKKE